ncbi:MAG: six-hairpin glycosidase [Cyclobacteriaceae bacterium]
MKNYGRYFYAGLAMMIYLSNTAQEVRYTGETLSNVDYHHGQLRPAVGVHNIQVMRANREHPEMADGFGWTYNHAPNIAYWNGQFYLHYLADPIGEHIPPSKTFLVTSADGYDWGMPQVLVPSYKIPDGYTKEGEPGVASDLFTVMHQRMGFFVSEENRLLTLAYHGITMHKKDGPNDGEGIGRVVREIYKDGSLGPIYFIRYNHGWNQKNTDYPFYKKSKDKGFVKACEELLGDPLMMQQWVEEADRDDPLIPLKKQFKAFSYYHLDDGNVVGLWKHGLSAISADNGKSWPRPERAPGFVTKNAKIWGQRTSDGRFATVYNPSEFRWPMAVSVSEEGLDYTNLLLINGEISPMRYGGNYKSYGPQYVRGILEGNGEPEDGKMWVTYSMNKEDMWVSAVPVPITSSVSTHVDDDFDEVSSVEDLTFYNIFSPRWAPVSITDGAIKLSDKDPFDYAKLSRIVPSSKKLSAEFEIVPSQNDFGLLHIEFQDSEGSPAIRLIFDEDGILKYKNGYRNSGAVEYEAGETYTIKIDLDVETRMYDLTINGNKKEGRIFFAPVHEIERIVFRTGEVRRFPDADTPTDQDYDLYHSGEPVEEASFLIQSLKTQ